MSAAADVLNDVPLFSSLSATEREELGASLKTVRHAKGTLIFRVGDPGDALYVVRAGVAEVFFKNNTGEEIVLEVAGPGEVFGELSLLDRGPRSASVRVVEDVEAVCLNREALERFLLAHPGAAMGFLAVMGRRMRVSAEQLRHTATRNSNDAVQDNRSYVEKLTDGIATFAGSISFLVLHVIWFTLWLLFNTVKVPGIPLFDAYPFGFLTLTVSLEAIFLSVFVLLSQNRQAAKDRVRADVEYDVNLKAELEIMHLHEKVDRLNADVLDHLERIQRALPPGAPPSGA